LSVAQIGQQPCARGASSSQALPQVLLVIHEDWDRKKDVSVFGRLDVTRLPVVVFELPPPAPPSASSATGPACWPPAPGLPSSK
jgi:hypothetical protein